MTRTHYFTACSLDGFMATVNHSLDWLLTQDNDPNGPMGYQAFEERIGALVMGASTYRWLLDHGGEWPYEIPAWVFTHREFPPPAGDVRFTQSDIAEVHREMTEAAAGRDLWLVGGGELAGQFADRGLVDEVWFQYAPVTLGAGIPVLPRRLDLKLLEVVQNGSFVCSRHEVVK
jgi:dihydrofolate reductase